MHNDITTLIGDAVEAFQRAHGGKKPTVLRLGRNEQGRLARHLAQSGARATGAAASPTYDEMLIEQIDLERCLQLE